MPRVLPIIFIVLSLFLSTNSTIFAQTAPKTYYVDCTVGSDSNLGTSPTTAWKTIAKANTATLIPGDSLLLKRGCSWTHSQTGSFLTATWTGTVASPITIGAYGTGENPKLIADARATSRNQILVLVTGAYLQIENLNLSLINPYREPTCLEPSSTPVRLGWYVGVSIKGTHNVIRTVEAHNLALGIFLQDESANNRVTNMYVHDLNSLWRLDKVNQAMGALGVLLHGDDNEVSYSRFERNWAECYYTDDQNYQRYGAPFEIYNANRSYVHHNEAYGHHKHFEMGKDSSHTTNDNVAAYNLFVSDRANAKGFNIHGVTNPYGPVNNTSLFHNTIIFTGQESEALVCDCDGGALIQNNIFVAEKKAAYLSENFTESYNLYWDYQKTTDTTADPYIQINTPTTQTAISPTSLKVNPLLINSLIPGGNYRLSAQSPAIDKGFMLSTSHNLLGSVLANDLDDRMVPTGTSRDLGAYEFATTSPTSPPTHIIGDANGDGLVNLTDFGVWVNNYLRAGSGASQGDFNSSGKIDGLDYVLWRKNSR